MTKATQARLDEMSRTELVGEIERLESLLDQEEYDRCERCDVIINFRDDRSYIYTDDGVYLCMKCLAEMEAEQADE